MPSSLEVKRTSPTNSRIICQTASRKQPHMITCDSTFRVGRSSRKHGGRIRPERKEKKQCLELVPLFGIRLRPNGKPNPILGVPKTPKTSHPFPKPKGMASKQAAVRLGGQPDLPTTKKAQPTSSQSRGMFAVSSREMVRATPRRLSGQIFKFLEATRG